MFELLEKLAVEGWWAWAIFLFVVTIAYLSRHRVGLAALVRYWEPWKEEQEIKDYLAEGEEVQLVEGPVLITDRRVVVRKRARGISFAQGALKDLCNVDYNETWLVPSILFGILYIILGGLAFAFSGEVVAMAILGGLIALAGLAVLLAPIIMRPASLILTFSSGKPIIITGRLSVEKLGNLTKVLLTY